jgi:hypothetical protein
MAASSRRNEYYALTKWKGKGQNLVLVGCWCFMLIILVTCKADSWRITIEGQPGQIVLEIPSPK